MAATPLKKNAPPKKPPMTMDSAMAQAMPPSAPGMDTCPQCGAQHPCNADMGGGGAGMPPMGGMPPVA